jgi:hypothetical protein
MIHQEANPRGPGGHPEYHEILRELGALHEIKSNGYGTYDSPLENFYAVGRVNQRAPYAYAMDRMTEKLARANILYLNGRIDELEEEFKDIASLAICAEALRRESVR